MFLKVLDKKKGTFLSSFPSFRWVLISAISVASSPYPRKNDRHWGSMSNRFLQISKISVTTLPSSVTREGICSASYLFCTALMAPFDRLIKYLGKVDKVDRLPVSKFEIVNNKFYEECIVLSGLKKEFHLFFYNYFTI